MFLFGVGEWLIFEGLWWNGDKFRRKCFFVWKIICTFVVDFIVKWI